MTERHQVQLIVNQYPVGETALGEKLTPIHKTTVRVPRLEGTYPVGLGQSGEVRMSLLKKPPRILFENDSTGKVELPIPGKKEGETEVQATKELPANSGRVTVVFPRSMLGKT